MTRAPRRPPARKWLAAALASLALLLGGCVFLRLLAFKHQLAAFDRNFTLETTDGVRLGCLNPVLLSDDFRWLGITPESIIRVGRAEQWHVRWIKQPLPGVTEDVVRDVDAELIFTDGKLTRLFVPERYFAVIPKSFLIGLIRGAGAADVDRTQRSAAVSLSRPGEIRVDAQVTQSALVTLLGPPSEQRVEGARTMLRYVYAPTPPREKGGRFEMTFSFETGTGRLLLLKGRLPVGQLAFNFEPPPGSMPPAARADLPPKL
ncbi:MAG: hypothetical protein HY736_19835 [Verrucomicrobia bacterium]|nr:hypothetical protein [Verrucomicrobiota bacterium]